MKLYNIIVFIAIICVNMFAEIIITPKRKKDLWNRLESKLEESLIKQNEMKIQIQYISNSFQEKQKEQLEKDTDSPTKMEAPHVEKMLELSMNESNIITENLTTKQDTIVDELLCKKKNQFNRSIRLLITSGIIYWNIDSLYNIDRKILFFLAAFIVLIIISQLLVSYRIKKGYYGTNYEEAKELLYFIKDDSNKNGRNSGKKIFNEVDNYEKKKAVVPLVNRKLKILKNEGMQRNG